MQGRILSVRGDGAPAHSVEGRGERHLQEGGLVVDAVGAREARDAEELRGADVGQDHELLDDLLALEALLGASPLPGWRERSVEARPGGKKELQF